MKTLAIATMKGGVGKTATAHALGAVLANDYRRRVLLVDADPQCSLTLACSVAAEGRSLAEVLDGSLSLDNVLVEIGPGLHLAPSDIALAQTELRLVAEIGRENALKRALAPIRNRFDICLIDCPPSLGILTVNALNAATAVLVPTQPQVADLRGVRLFLDTVEQVRARLNDELDILGILPTFYDERLLHHQSAIRAMRDAGLPLLPVAIGRTIRIAEAAAEGESVTTFEPGNKQALAYQELGGIVEQWLNDAAI